MKQKTLNMLTQVQQWWHEYWLFRWTIANVIGWNSGLILAGILIWLIGFPGMLLSGVVITGGLAIAQAWCLFTKEEMPLRYKWSIYSSLAGGIAIFPAGVFILLGFFNLWLALILAALVFSGILSLVQSFVLVAMLDDNAYLWIPVNILAGIITAIITVPILQSPIPLLFSPASVVFGLITGKLLMRWMNTTEELFLAETGNPQN